MKNFNIYIAALLLAGSLNSCSDFLDAENKSAGLTAGEYFTTEEGQQALLTDAYRGLYSVVPNATLHDLGTDLYMHVRGTDPGDFGRHTISPADGTVTSFYKNLYALINYSNGVIRYSGDADTKAVAEAKFIRNVGYYYLTQHFGAVPYITNYINDAKTDYPRVSLEELYPAMIEELEQLYGNTNLPSSDLSGRASKRAVAALLARVYLAAAWDLDTDLTDAVSGTYSVKSTSRFIKAAEWAEKAIDGQQLTMSFADKWSPFNEKNDEVIWAIQYEMEGFIGENVANGGHSLQGAYGGYYGDPTKTGLKQVGSCNAPNNKAINLWTGIDERFDATFMRYVCNYLVENGDLSANWGKMGYFGYYHNTAAQNETVKLAYKYYGPMQTEEEVKADIEAHKEQFVKGDYLHTPKVRHYNGDASKVYEFNADGSIKKVSTKKYEDICDEADGGCFAIKKWDFPESPQSTGNNDYRDVPVFHVSEMYLVAAEAYLMAGQEAEALKKVNAVRTRAKAEPLSSFSAYEPQYEVSSGFGSFTALDVILDESAREMFGELKRYADLRRTRQLVRYVVEFNKFVGSVNDMSDAFGNIRWYRPIPADALTYNTNPDLVQNPGY